MSKLESRLVPRQDSALQVDRCSQGVLQLKNAQEPDHFIDPSATPGSTHCLLTCLLRSEIMMALDLPDGTFAGITAFYTIVTIPHGSLPVVSREMERVLEPDGLLLFAFHTGDEVLYEDELWGRSIPWISSSFNHRKSDSLSPTLVPAISALS